MACIYILLFQLFCYILCIIHLLMSNSFFLFSFYHVIVNVHMFSKTFSFLIICHNEFT